MERRITLAFIHFSVWSDVGGIFAGKFFGKDHFAKSISPAKTMQGIYGAVILPVIISLIFY
jgi:phosphatidate cytidylyltransferase